MPFQLVNDSATVAIAGSQTSPTVRTTGTMTMPKTTTLSRALSRRTRLFWGTPPCPVPPLPPVFSRSRSTGTSGG